MNHRRSGMRFAVLLVPLLTISCAASESADWYGDERFTTEERAAVEAGATWLYTEAGMAPPRIAWGYELAGNEPMAKTIRRERGPTASGECVGGTLYLSPSPDLAGLAAHELAHCVLGFGDRYRADEEKSEGIMRVLTPMRWTDSEDRQCAASVACRRGKP